jgi:hypothetical protein
MFSGDCDLVFALSISRILSYTKIIKIVYKPCKSNHNSSQYICVFIKCFLSVVLPPATDLDRWYCLLNKSRVANPCKKRRFISWSNQASCREDSYLSYLKKVLILRDSEPVETASSSHNGHSLSYYVLQLYVFLKVSVIDLCMELLFSLYWPRV